MEQGTVTLEVDRQIATITFSHPKSNCLPGALLKRLAAAVQGASAHSDLHAVILKSNGEGAFCAGASFTELVQLSSLEEGTAFFMGFANVILAIRECPCPVICRVQGKVVGGGVGIVAAADMVFAESRAAVRLSELSLGLGPYVIEPAIVRKIGKGHTHTLGLGGDWQDSQWALNAGLFNKTFASVTELDRGIAELSDLYRSYTRDGLCSLKQTLWEGTSDWSRLLPARAEESARLTLLESTQATIKARIG